MERISEAQGILGSDKSLENRNPFASSGDELLEEPRTVKHGLTDAGMDRHPLDTLASLAHIRRIQDQDRKAHGEAGSLKFFMASDFQALNMPRNEAQEFFDNARGSVSERADYLEAASEVMGIEDVEVVGSEEVFRDQNFYRIAAEIAPEGSSVVPGASYDSAVSVKRDVDATLPESVISRGMTAEEALQLYSQEHGIGIPEELLQTVDSFEEETGESMQGSHLYGILEIAATEYMRRELDVNCKSGHDHEIIYDKKIDDLIQTARYNQPLSLGSERHAPGTRTPYTVWPGREGSRLLLRDSEEEMKEKLENAETNYVVASPDDIQGTGFNPVVGNAMVAAETFAALEEDLEVEEGINLSSAEEVIEYVMEEEPEGYTAEALAEQTLDHPYRDENPGSVTDKVDQNSISNLKDELPCCYSTINGRILEEM